MASTSEGAPFPNIDFTLPELAWRCNFGGGAVSASSMACIKYMPDPVVPFIAKPEIQKPDIRSGANGLPGVNVMMVSNEEVVVVRKSLPGIALGHVPGVMESYANEGRINMIMSAPANLKSSQDQRLKFLLKFMREAYPGEIGEYLHVEGDTGFKHLVSQLLVDTVRYSLKEIYPDYAKAFPNAMSLGRGSLEGITNDFGDHIGRNLNSVFFNDEKPRNTGTQEPSL